MNRLHLVCNAHLDPVWLWEWEEGAAAAISTFRVAADFCEEFEGFVFNHNEVALYQWVEEYEPVLFARIQRLVQEGKWHIMGGWYLQPDCNMPSGESFVRQILLGRTYFKEKFDATPTTAINFDPFGHTRGLVQILKKSGYDSYLFCRPDQNDCPLPADDFIWVGYDGSEIIGHRASTFYNSALGKAHEKVAKWIELYKGKETGLMLWGVGNHGGGPSRTDLQILKTLMKENNEYEIMHSTPETYFAELNQSGVKLEHHEKDLNPWGVGCYTSQVRIKQKHRMLENGLYMLEKMISSATLQGLMEYPFPEIHQALQSLLFSEFHDILPGSSIQSVEDTSLRVLDHGLEIVSRLKARAFFALSNGQKKAEEGEIPILVYNPHPYKMQGIFECEFQLQDQNWGDGFSLPVVYQNGIQIPSQAEKEASNLSLDWRKHTIFMAELEPYTMNRFNCKITMLPQKPLPVLSVKDGKVNFVTNDIKVVINALTGLLDTYEVKGVPYILENAFSPLVMQDSDDSWGTTAKSFAEMDGSFTLMSPEEGTRFSGIEGTILNSVRIIEDGAVRTVVEALLSYGDSFICLTYKLPKVGSEIEIHVRVHWNEKKKMLKLSIPTNLANASFKGQVAYGVADLPMSGKEAVAQKWIGLFDEQHNQAITCINDGVYGSDCQEGEIRISLLRSSAYSGLPIFDRPIVPQDRYMLRMDQGERLYTFWLRGGPSVERKQAIDREALIHNEKPFVLSFFPAGTGKVQSSFAQLSDDSIQMTAFKKEEKGENYIIRLFEPTGKPCATTLEIPYFSIKQEFHLEKFEIKTLCLDIEKRELMEVNLMES